MPYIVVGLVLLAVALAFYAMITRISAIGGSSDDHPLDIVNRTLGEADAFRGTQSPENPPWDGVTRLAPPTQDGGFA